MMDRFGFAGWMEVLPETSGRRIWLLETKLRIVAESYAAGASVGEVARRYDLSPNQVTCWRRLYRRGELVPRGSPPLPPIVSDGAGSPPAGEVAGEVVVDLPAFVPLVLEAFDAAAPSRLPAAADVRGSSTDGSDGRIEIEADGVMVRLPGVARSP